MLRGSITALITPFANGEVDEKAFASFVDWQIKQRDARAGAGRHHRRKPDGDATRSTAASSRSASKSPTNRVPVIAGAGSNSTDEAVSLTRFAEEIGADAVLSVVPYYNKPTQEGMFQHFSAVAKATKLPIILYSRARPHRGRPHRRHHRPAARGARATSRASRTRPPAWSAPACSAPSSATDFVLLSGEDMTALGFNAHGGHGCISVTSNVAPKLCAQFQNACQQGNYAGRARAPGQARPAPQGAVPREQPGRREIRGVAARPLPQRVPPAGRPRSRATTRRRSTPRSSLRGCCQAA